MPPIVPTVPRDTVNLADVLPGCLAAMGHADVVVATTGREARLALRPARSAVVVLVDGLGANALAARAGHARWLSGFRRRMRSGFPTTTAAALSTLTTGMPPGQHGVVGYSGHEPASGRVVNLLSGWDREVPVGWLLRPTLFTAASEAGVAVHAVGPARYRTSGFTASVLGGAVYDDADTIPERVDASLRAVEGDAHALVYLYVPELDSIGHKQGWESGRWTAALEVLDGELARLAGALPSDVGLVVTADHGVLTVPDEANIAIDDDLLTDVVSVAGDPRCRQLTVAPGTDVDALVALWRSRHGKRAWIASRSEAIAAGWFGEVDDRVLPRIGDVVVAARASWAFNDERSPKRHDHMSGQHGSLTDDEVFVPLVLTGAFA